MAAPLPPRVSWRELAPVRGTIASHGTRAGWPRHQGDTDVTTISRTHCEQRVQNEGILQSARVVRFTNCRSVVAGVLSTEDVCVRDGVVVDPADLFYAHAATDVVVDCEGLVLAPGFLDLQINGAIGVDFSDPSCTVSDVRSVGRACLRHGVTAICPTIVSSASETYKHVLATVFAAMQPPDDGDEASAATQPWGRFLGLHLEGPFIARERKGAHAEEHLRAPTHTWASLREVYGSDYPGSSLPWDTSADTSACVSACVRIVTLAPELEGGQDTVAALTRAGVVASIGHSSADIRIADAAVARGACLITHLFNAQTGFHHRDPGIPGLLGRMYAGGVVALAGFARYVPDTDVWTREMMPKSALSDAAPARPAATNTGALPASSIHGGYGDALPRPATAGTSSVSADAGSLPPRRRGGSPDRVVPMQKRAGVRSVITHGAAADGASTRSTSGMDAHVLAPTQSFSIRSLAPNVMSPLAAGAPKFHFPVKSALSRALGESSGASRMPADVAAAQPSPKSTMAPFGSSVLTGTRSPSTTTGRVTPFTCVPSYPRQRMPDGTYDIGRPFYSLIADGVHVHPYAVAVAFSTHRSGLILVTDAMAAMGLPLGTHALGGLRVDIHHGLEDGHYDGLHAVLSGTQTLAGAVVPLHVCLRNLMAFTGCSFTQALATVTLHPARVLRLHNILGDLRPGCWADMVLIDDGRGAPPPGAASPSPSRGVCVCEHKDGARCVCATAFAHMRIRSTFLAGKQVWSDMAVSGHVGGKAPDPSE